MGAAAGVGASGSHGHHGVEHWVFSQLRTWGVNSKLPAWKKGREPQPRGFRNLAFETSKLGLELSAWNRGGGEWKEDDEGRLFWRQLLQHQSKKSRQMAQVLPLHPSPSFTLLHPMRWCPPAPAFRKVPLHLMRAMKNIG